MAAKLFKTKNMSVDSRKKQARILRIFRKIHKTLGIFLFVFFIFISLTGFLLGLKKHSNGFLLPETKNGSTSDFKEWLSMDSLYIIAKSLNSSGKIDRIDVRKDKGIVKFTVNESLLTREEIFKAKDLGQYFKVSSDIRDLNYDLYFSQGNKKISKIQDYSSNTVKQLNQKETEKILLSLDYY